MVQRPGPCSLPTQGCENAAPAHRRLPRIRPIATTLSLRRLWALYERTSVAHGTSGEGDLALSHLAFYSGARRVLKVLAFLIERGDYEERHGILHPHPDRRHSDRGIDSLRPEQGPHHLSRSLRPRESRERPSRLAGEIRITHAPSEYKGVPLP